MSSERIYRIEPDGTLLFLTHGDDELMELGDVEIVRASHVRFDHDEKLWFVYLRKPHRGELKQYPGHKTRRAALDAEIQICQDLLLWHPGWIDQILEVKEYDMTGAPTSG